MELCLGTVQFGMKYGINNTLGQPSKEDSFDMLDTAIENGIKVIDTAYAYGDAEQLLGDYFKRREHNNDIQVISKLCPNIIDDDKHAKEIIYRECHNSIKKMGLDHLYGYLLHTPQYINNKHILDALCDLKSDGLVENIGVSIYDIEDGDTAISSGVVDFIQLPYSILDQRGMKTGFIKRAKKSNITIFTRSAFLQGLFMMDINRIPTYLTKAIPYLELFEELLKKYEIDRVDAIVHFVKKTEGIDYLVFGVDTKQQLLQDIESFNERSIPDELINELMMNIQNVENSIIFPSLWSNGKKVN